MIIAYSAQGVGHTVPFHESVELDFFGITGNGPTGPALGNPPVTTTPPVVTTPPPVVTTQGEEFEVEQVVDARWVGRTRKTLQYLVHWAGYPISERTWEPRDTLMEDAPEAIEDFYKVHPDAPGAQGTTPPPSVSSRRCRRA